MNILKEIFKTNNIIKKLLLIVILAAIGFLLLSLLTKPLRIRWSKNYIKSGDQFLLQKKYLHADLEYKKSLSLFWGNKESRERLILSKKAEENVLLLAPLYQENGAKTELDQMKSASDLPKYSIDGVKDTKALLEAGEFQLATVKAKNSTEMDKSYRDAWLYLGIANLETSQNVELASLSRKSYLEQAKSALEKAKTIDPEYTTTKDYLERTNKLMTGK